MVTHLEIEARYVPELRSFCRRMMNSETAAEDVVQDLMTTVCRLAGGAVGGGGQGPPTEVALDSPRLRGWLYRIARNRCIDELRRKRPELRLSSSDATKHGGALDPQTTPGGKAIKRERIAETQAALQSLSDDLRAVVIMRVYHNLNREEMAEALGLSVAGVKDRLARAFRHLRAALIQLNDSCA